MICPNCHNQIDSKSNHCPYCGTALFAQQESASSATSPQPPQPSEPSPHPMEKGTQYYVPPGYANQASYYPYPPFPQGAYPSSASQPQTAPPEPAGQAQAQQNPIPDTFPNANPSKTYQNSSAQPAQTKAAQNQPPQPPQQAPQQWFGGQGIPGCLYPNGPYSGAQPLYNGHPQQEQTSFPAQNAEQVMVKQKQRKIWPIVLICLGALAVIGTAVTLIVMLLLPKPAGSGLASPQAVADQFMGSILEGNGEQILNLAPDAVIQRLMEEENYASREEMVEEMNTGILMILSYINMMDVAVDYTVGEPQPVDDSVMSDLQESYQEIGLSVTDAKEVPISFLVDGEESSTLEADDLLTVQINGQWYLDFTLD